uniref:Transmembrane protein n=1 Tax=Glossina palpalis gambiensis TaxID=67801 RepID=A0A1B0AVL5_9MUSC
MRKFLIHLIFSLKYFNNISCLILQRNTCFIYNALCIFDLFPIFGTTPVCIPFNKFNYNHYLNQKNLIVLQNFESNALVETYLDIIKQFYIIQIVIQFLTVLVISFVVTRNYKYNILSNSNEQQQQQQQAQRNRDVQVVRYEDIKTQPVLRTPAVIMCTKFSTF